jgi:hypothetical protein
VPKIRFAPVARLHPHPLLDRVGTMMDLASHFHSRARKAGKNRDEHKERAAELEGDWQTLVASVKAEGVLEPIKICKIPADDDTPRPLGTEFWIVDGRNRWRAAQHAGLKRVPYLLVHPEDATAIIMATVTGRRHYSKGATAYLACLMHPEFAADNSRGPKVKSEGANSALSAELLATRFSVSTRLLEQAAELFRLLADHPTFRTDAEADVWAGCGLGGILAGVKSLIATGALEPKAPADRKAFLAWATVRGFAAEHQKLADRWADLSPQQRDQATVLIATAAAKLPPEIRTQLKAAL